MLPGSLRPVYRSAARALLHTADFTRDAALCLCGAPRDAHNGAQNAGGHPDTRCRKYRRDPAYDLARAAHRALSEDHTTVVNAWQATEYPRPEPRPGGYGVGASDHTTCRRKIQYRELGLPDGYEPDEVNELAAIIGQLIHDAFLRAHAARYPWRDYEMLLAVPGLDRSVRIDMYDAVLGIASDVKCTTLDTPVLMADGSEKPAGDIAVGDIVAAWDEHTNRLVPAPVAWTGDNGVQPIYKISTRGGRTLRVTENHPILVQRGSYRVWVKAADIHPGDRAVAALGWTPAEADRSGLPLSDAYLLGALAGDGGLTGGAKRNSQGSYGTLFFHNIDQEVLVAVDEALGAHGMGLSKRTNHPCNNPITARTFRGRHATEPAAFRGWLGGHKMLVGAHDKHVPEAVMTGGPDVWCEFLSGYLDTDGTVYELKTATRGRRVTVTWASVSREMLRQVQTLLAGLGIQSAISGVKNKLNNREFNSWTLQVSNGYGITRLAELLHPRGEKAAKLSRAAQVVRAREKEVGRKVTYDLVTVTAVEVETPEPTVGIEIAGVHTHVTSGLITHNTKGENAWERLRENGPSEGEWKQLATYCRGLQARGETPELMEIIAIRRSDGTVERFYRDYDEDYGKAAVAELKAIAANLDLARRGLLDLPRDGHGPTGKNADPICRDYCPFKTACWNLPRAEELGRSPESLAALGEFDDPIGEEDRENIAYAAGLGREWRDAENEAKKERTKAYMMLVGVPSGEYGDCEVVVRRKRTPLHGKYYAEVQAAIDRGATTEEIAKIHLEYSVSEHVEVKKIRAAKRRPTTPHNPERIPS